MILLRRYLVLAALFFWQGGFTFYASVVVPVGQQVFGHLRQGFVTRQVTEYMMLSGAGMVLALIWLHWLHGRMDELLVTKGRIILDEEAFRPRHRLYLWISTVQWAFALLYLLLTLMLWRAQDQNVARYRVSSSEAKARSTS